MFEALAAAVLRWSDAMPKAIECFNVEFTGGVPSSAFLFHFD